MAIFQSMNPAASPILVAASNLERQGRFADALLELERTPPTKTARRATEVLRAQLLERTGKYSHSRSLVISLLKARDLDSADRSACELVAARLEWDKARVDDAIVHLQRSIHEAKQSKDLQKLCWSQLRLLGMLRETSGVDAASALFAELRANAVKLGDGTVLSALHIFVGQMDAQRGLFVSARRHTRIGLELLSKNPNLWLEATAENINFGIDLLLLNLEDGLERGTRALKLAEQSGAASTIATSLGNLGNLYIALGHFEAATDYHRRALGFVPPGGENWNGLLESLAQIELAQGRFKECQELLDQIEAAAITESDRRRYVYRYAGLTRSKLLARLDRRQEALETLTLTIRRAEECNDGLLVAVAQITKAHLLIEMRDTEAATRILHLVATTLPTLPPAFHAQYERTVGEVLLTKSEAHSASHLQRANRIYQALNNAPCLTELSSVPLLTADPRSDEVFLDRETRVGDVLQSVASLFVHHGRPEIAAREVIDVLTQAGVITAARAVKKEQSGRLREIARVDSSGRYDIDQPFEKDFKIKSIDGTTVEITATCRSDIESVATLNAISLLLNTLHDLERARIAREERATLWPVDELPPDNGDAILTGHMGELIEMARRIGPTNVTVLITGESGTGKEILARAIHAFSPRAAKPLIPFNCASIPREMLESQLFGHRRGAFTGAERDQPGVIRAARDGTLLLDEIGEMSLDLQPKLLRFLEAGEISPLGEPGPVTVNVRVVAATNAKLESLVQEGRFREDLYYRLNVFRLSIRPLRERRDEIPSLVNAFVARAAAEFQKGHITVAEETMEHLLLYPWPGNVRQLLNEVRRMVALAEPNVTLLPAHISSEIRARLPAFPKPNADNHQLEVPLRSKLTPTLSKVEFEMIKVALRDHSGKVDAAARALGISRKGLYLKRQRLGL